MNIKEGESKHQQDDLDELKVSEVFVICHTFFLVTLHDSFDWTIAFFAISVQYYAVKAKF